LPFVLFGGCAEHEICASPHVAYDIPIESCTSFTVSRTRSAPLTEILRLSDWPRRIVFCHL